MAYGQPFMAVWRAPYHETLLAFCGLIQRRRIDGLADHAQRVRDAFRVNAAFASPKELEKEQREVMRALRTPLMTEERQETAAEIVARFAPKVPNGD